MRERSQLGRERPRQTVLSHEHVGEARQLAKLGRERAGQVVVHELDILEVCERPELSRYGAVEAVANGDPAVRDVAVRIAHLRGE